MKELPVILSMAIATASIASDLRSLNPNEVTQSFPHLGFEVSASIVKDANLNLSISLDGKKIEVPKEALEGLDSPQLGTIAFASPSSTGMPLARDHLKKTGFEVTLEFGKVRSHGESGVTTVFVYSHVTLYFGPEGFTERILVVPEGDYSNKWKTFIESDGTRYNDRTISSIECPDPRFPNRWLTAEDIDNRRKLKAEMTSEGILPSETKPAEPQR